ncbi:MAG TPA: response regulator transcription factor [Sphingomicrobium sp.]|jgi:two-component system KDP operon response regulator KdpE|nr:response regulator transcription factor [Sphingomicrobium sp.]
MTGYKIVIVDDEPAIRRLLRAALERVGYLVVEASTAREAQNALDIDRPDAVLLDLGLPDREGLELVPLIARSGAALLVISAREATSEKIAALDLGADDYVTKPFDSDEVLARLRRALRQRVSSGGGPVLNLDGLEIDLLARRVRRDGRDIHLTPKEYGVLEALAKHPGRVLTHAQLLRTVWGPAHERNVEYLRVTARGLRAKIEQDPGRPRIIKTEPAVGYRLAADETG